MKLEIGLKLKKTLREIDAMPVSEFMLWAALLMKKAEERKKAFNAAKNRRGNT